MTAKRSRSDAKHQTAPSDARLTSRQLQSGLKAGIAAWIFPGAGHYLLGARKRALIFTLLVLATVTLGLACDGNLALIDSGRAPVLSGLQVFGNLSLGPMEPIIRYGIYGALIYKAQPSRGRPIAEEISSMPPRRQAIARRQQRSFRPRSPYGTAYLMAAGLMNLLLVLDAWDIGIGRKR